MREISGLIIVLLCLMSALSYGQTFPMLDEKIDIYVECGYCDINLMRSKINYVNHVRDQRASDIHVMVNRLRSGANGFQHTLKFYGRGPFNSQNYELSFSESPNTTSRERNQKITQLLETGLVPYWMQTHLRDEMEFTVHHLAEHNNIDENEPHEDPWNQWVFSVEAGGSYDAESNTNDYRAWTRIRADQVTELWRVRNLLYARYDAQRFERDETVINSTRERSYASSSAVRSISDHLSAGVFASLSRSTYNNLDLSTRIAPAIEYSIFPYSEVNDREVTVGYRLSHLYRDYTEETIFLEVAEHLFNHSLVMAARFRQPWGSLYAQLEGSHFFHDIEQNRLEFEGFLSLKVTKGLSITLGNEIEIINDQRSLPARDISLEELLLAQRQTATNFRINGEVGLRYTFGSIYNNVVNTRL